METVVEIQTIESAQVLDIGREISTNEPHYPDEKSLLRRLSSLERRIRLANNNRSIISDKIDRINEQCSSLLMNTASRKDIENLKFYIFSGLCVSFALGALSLAALLYLAKTL